MSADETKPRTSEAQCECSEAIDGDPLCPVHPRGERARPANPFDATPEQVAKFQKCVDDLKASSHKQPAQRAIYAVAQDVHACASAWEPGARLVGNVRADEVVYLAEYAMSAHLDRAAGRKACAVCGGPLPPGDALRSLGMSFCSPDCARQRHDVKAAQMPSAACGADERQCIAEHTDCPAAAARSSCAACGTTLGYKLAERIADVRRETIEACAKVVEERAKTLQQLHGVHTWTTAVVALVDDVRALAAPFTSATKETKA